jgi:hypothetical protein
MFTRFTLGYRGLKIPTHGLLAPFAVLFAFVVLIIFSFLIEAINGLDSSEKAGKLDARKND